MTPRCDGSVHFVVDSVDPSLFNTAASINGGPAGHALTDVSTGVSHPDEGNVEGTGAIAVFRPCPDTTSLSAMRLPRLLKFLIVATVWCGWTTHARSQEGDFYFSSNPGDWNDAATWTRFSPSGPMPGIPGINDTAQIGGFFGSSNPEIVVRTATSVYRVQAFNGSGLAEMRPVANLDVGAGGLDVGSGGTVAIQGSTGGVRVNGETIAGIGGTGGNPPGSILLQSDGSHAGPMLQTDRLTIQGGSVRAVNLSGNRPSGTATSATPGLVAEQVEVTGGGNRGVLSVDNATVSGDLIVGRQTTNKNPGEPDRGPSGLVEARDLAVAGAITLGPSENNQLGIGLGTQSGMTSTVTAGELNIIGGNVSLGPVGRLDVAGDLTVGDRGSLSGAATGPQNPNLPAERFELNVDGQLAIEATIQNAPFSVSIASDINAESISVERQAVIGGSVQTGQIDVRGVGGPSQNAELMFGGFNEAASVTVGGATGSSGELNFSAADGTIGNGSIVTTKSLSLQSAILPGSDPMSGSTNVNSSLVINNGTLNVSGLTTIDSGSSLSVLDGVANLGDLTLDGGTVRAFMGGTIQTTGTLTLNAGSIETGGGITGNVAVNDGLFAFNGDINGDLTITGGLTRLNGTVTGDLRMTGGTLAPGQSPGTTTIAGTYTQSASVLEMELQGTSPGDFDRLIANQFDLNAGSQLFVTLRGHSVSWSSWGPVFAG